MFLSIIIPSLNHGEFIEKCLNSIVKQKFSHGYEIIIVDKFSRDQTDSIIKKYKKKYNNIFLFKKNYDQSQAINFGFHKSRGLYCTWQNCDDYYHFNTFNQFYKAYKKKGYADVIYGNMDLLDLNKKKSTQLIFNRVCFYNLISEGMVVSNQSAIFKKSLFPEYNLKKLHNSFDYEFFLRLAYDKKEFQKVKSNKSLATFSVHERQKSYRYTHKDTINRNKIILGYKKNFFDFVIYNKFISKFIRLIYIIIDYGLLNTVKYIFR
jgi:glycosyltransferase involved in cell wall biosynthesis